MKKQTIYIASLEEVLNGRYYDIESLEDYQNAVENFLDICEKRNLSDDLEIQYIDGELTGEATDYIEDVLRLAEENEEELDIISALFKIFDIDEIEKILASVCGCYNVSLKDVVDAVNNGCDTVDKVAEVTKAGAACGRCKALVQNVIDIKR